MAELPSVTVAVLNYNGLEHLTGCFASLAQIDYPPERLELMLLDNASQDGSVAYVQSNHPSVRIVVSDQNLGFAGGNNLAAREATGEYIVFLNNDMRVDVQFVRGLAHAVQSAPGVACAGAKILNWDGSRLDFAGSAADFAGHAYQFGLGQLLAHDTFTEMLWAVTHLLEELGRREDLMHLTESDLDHLSGDLARAYRALAVQWVGYMEHLQKQFPYLFSLAVRTNPLDPDARAEIG